jgi:hypothetical protein
MGVAQLAYGEPMVATATLLFHDAVELTLDAAIEHLNILAKSPNFGDHFNLINQKIGPQEVAHLAWPHAGPALGIRCVHDRMITPASCEGARLATFTSD